jgi:hypothetical protein
VKDTEKGFSLNEYGLLVSPELRDGYLLEVRWSHAARGRSGERRPDLIIHVEGRDRARHRLVFGSVENAMLRDFGLQNIVYEILILRDHQIQDEDLHCLIEGFSADAYSAACLAELRGKISHEQMTLVVLVPANGARLSVLCKDVEFESA